MQHGSSEELIRGELELIDRLGSFLSRWYGEPDRVQGSGVTTEGRLHKDLADWWRLVECWSEPVVRFNIAVEPAALRSDAGFVTFWIENQGGITWSYPDSMHDSTVYVESGGPWVDTERTVADFLFEMTLCEAAMDPPFSARARRVPRRELEKLRIDGHRLRLGDWGWPAVGAELYVEGSHLIDVVPSFGATDYFDVSYCFLAEAARNVWLSQYEGGINFLPRRRRERKVFDDPGDPPPF
ncbi:hypothetical protein [Antribacter gilvus]|uniref:hypothetical protein n=1 Tax=Antribacter gilvus TaxID=2304675 RepID=UPI000F7B4F71|nr:hypothetical protein [Antribacter gilvus]